MSGTWTLQAGLHFVYDGDPCTIVEICDGAIIARDRSGRSRRLRMVDVLRPVSEGARPTSLAEHGGRRRTPRWR